MATASEILAVAVAEQAFVERVQAAGGRMDRAELWGDDYAPRLTCGPSERGYVVLRLSGAAVVGAVLGALDALVALGPVQLYAEEVEEREHLGWAVVVSYRTYLWIGMTVAQHERLEVVLDGALEYACCDPHDKEGSQLYLPLRDAAGQVVSDPETGEVISRGEHQNPLEVCQDTGGAGLHGCPGCGAWVGSNRKRVRCPGCGERIGLS